MKRLLPVYPWPLHPIVKAQLAELPDINPVEALPGGPGPVLAIRKLPPFVCDAVLVSEPQRLADAVHIVTSDGIEMVSMRTHLDALDETVEPFVSRVKFT